MSEEFKMSLTNAVILKNAFESIFDNIDARLRKIEERIQWLENANRSQIEEPIDLIESYDMLMSLHDCLRRYIKCPFVITEAKLCNGVLTIKTVRGADV
jgi:hypothetical protein